MKKKLIEILKPEFIKKIFINIGNFFNDYYRNKKK
jgi:hypothetical protein